MTRPAAASGVTLAVVAVALVALNLRGSITAVPPLLSQLQAEMGLSATGASLLTTLPVLLFALAAPFSARLGARLGPARAILLGLVLIVVGTVGRVLGGDLTLMVGTLVLGVGMTIGNVLVPVVAKRDFGDRAPQLIGVFTASLAVGATITAAGAVPVAQQLGWRGGLGVWVVLALVALPVWWVAVVRREPPPTRGSDDARGQRRGPSVWRQPLAWVVAVALGTQSALFYSGTTWIPTYLVEVAGVSELTAGWALSVFQVTSIPFTLAVPWLTRLRPTQGWIGGVVAIGWVVLVLGLHLAPQAWLAWVVIGGASQGAGFALALTLVVLRSASAEVTGPLSGMSQLVGYTIGAAGPFVVGALAAATGGWVLPGVFLLLVAAVQLGTTWVAGQRCTVV